MSQLGVDVETFLLTLLAGNLLVLLLLLAYRADQRKEPAFVPFLYSKLAQALGWSLYAAGPLINPTLVSAAASVLVMVGFGLEAVSPLVLRRRVTRAFGSAVGGSLIVALAVYAGLAVEHSSLKFVLGSLIGGALFSIPGIYLIAQRGSSRLQRVAAVLYLVLAAAGFARAVVAVLYPAGFNPAALGPLQIATFGVLYALLILGSIAYLLLSEEEKDRALELAASRDSLTGMLNRRAFHAETDRYLSMARRQGDPVSLLVLDLDEFKRINDEYGHQAGDLVLRDISAIIDRNIRQYDFAGRFGGDEFVVLLPRTNEEAARAVAERVAGEARQRQFDGYPGMVYTVSIGVATSDGDELTALELLTRSADIALYEAKRGGRDCVVVAARAPGPGAAAVNPAAARIPRRPERGEIKARICELASGPGTRTERASRVTEFVRELGGYRWVGIYEVTDAELAVLGWSGHGAPAVPRFPVERGLNGAAVTARAPVIVPDVTRDSRYLTTFGSTRSEAIFPVADVDGRIVGTIDVESERIDAFRERDRDLLRRCAEAATVLWDRP